MSNRKWEYNIESGHNPLRLPTATNCNDSPSEQTTNNYCVISVDGTLDIGYIISHKQDECCSKLPANC